MSAASRWTRLATAVALFGVSGFLGLGLSGCSPAPEKSQPSGAQQPAPPQTEEPADPIVEEPAEPPAPEPEPPAIEEPAAPPAPEPMKTPADEPAPKTAPEDPAPEPAETPNEVEDKATTGSAATAIDPSKISTFAPAADLVAQVPEYIERLEEAVEDEEEYGDSVSKLVKDANVAILLSLALGLHDEDNKYKKAAPGMIEAAQELAAATDYLPAKAAVAKFKEAADATDGDPSTLEWNRVASMSELMKAVPLIHSRLKRYVRGSRFASQADETKGLTSVLAVVAHGSMPNAEDTDLPNEVEAWHKYCAQMRDASALVYSTIVAQDETAKDAAMETLQKSCDDCHAVFHPDPLVASEE